MRKKTTVIAIMILLVLAFGLLSACGQKKTIVGTWTLVETSMYYKFSGGESVSFSENGRLYDSDDCIASLNKDFGGVTRWEIVSEHTIYFSDPWGYSWEAHYSLNGNSLLIVNEYEGVREEYIKFKRA